MFVSGDILGYKIQDLILKAKCYRIFVFDWQVHLSLFCQSTLDLNPIALKMAKTLWSLGHSECKRVKVRILVIYLQFS